MFRPIPRRVFLLLTAIGAVGALGIWQRPTPAPRTVQLKPPVRLASAVIDAIDVLRPSPDGSTIALGTKISSGPTWNGKPFVVLFSRSLKKQIARIPTSPVGETDFVWDNRNRLWIARGNGWQVWQAPWKSAAYLADHLPAKIHKELSGPSAFEPNSQTIALCSSADAGLPLSVQLWRGGKPLCRVQLAKRAIQSGGIVKSLEWSPDGKQLAISLGGWTAYEWEGPHELWLLDASSGKMRRVAQGAAEEWVFADPDTQSTEPSWSPDAKSLVWGDQRFGINETNAVSAGERQLLASNAAGNEPTVSPSGRLLAFVRHSTPDGGTEPTLVVASRDGSWWARGPQLDIGELWAWSPARDELFFIAPDASGVHSLWSWHVER